MVANVSGNPKDIISVAHAACTYPCLELNPGSNPVKIAGNVISIITQVVY